MASKNEQIERAIRSPGYALHLDNTDSWLGLPVVLRARLDQRQRAALAFIALKSMDRDDAMLTAETALAAGAGTPQPPLFNHMDQAAFWADLAEPEELEAYCFTSFNRMAPMRQADFLGFVHGRRAA